MERINGYYESDVTMVDGCGNPSRAIVYVPESKADEFVERLKCMTLDGYVFRFDDISRLCKDFGVAFRPFSIERKTCKNVHRDADECGFFKCSECGVTVEDQEGYMVAMWFEDVDVNCQAGWRYCPQCGRIVTTD